MVVLQGIFGRFVDLFLYTRCTFIFVSLLHGNSLLLLVAAFSSYLSKWNVNVVFGRFDCMLRNL